MDIIKRHWFHFIGQLSKDKRAPYVVNILFALLAIITLFQILKLFWAPTVPKAVPLHVVTTEAVDLSSWHTFGVYQQNYENLPETNLTLQLKGVEVVVGGHLDHMSEAIVSDSNGKDKVYHIGEILPGGAVIKGILKDRIIIDNNGRLEKLSLPKKQLNQSQ